MRLVTIASATALFLLPSSVSAESVLTLELVLELARTQNPEVLIARAREAEAQGRLSTARVVLASNPELDVFAGPRDLRAPRQGSATDLELSATQRFEIGGQRGFRMGAANALIEQRRAETSAASLDAAARAATAFYRALHAQLARDVADGAMRVAEGILQAAEARFQAGETALFEVNLARVEKARATRERLNARMLIERAYGDLRVVLGLDPTASMAVQGDWPAAEPNTLEGMLEAMSARPDVRGLSAAVSGAEAEWRLAQAERHPDVLAGLGVRREEMEQTVGGRIGLSIPLFQRNAGAIASALARLDEARTALQTRRRTLETWVRAAHAQYVSARDAAAAVREDVLPLLEENARLAQESYQAGKISLIDVLVVRRETFAAHREALEAQLALALAITELRQAAGRID